MKKSSWPLTVFRDAALAWVAGPEHAYRTKVVFSDYPPVRVTRTDSTGRTTETWEKLDDRTLQSDLIHNAEVLNLDLKQAGLPDQTWGFNWYVRVKPGDDLNDLHKLLGPTVSIMNHRRVVAETRKIYENYLSSI